MNRRILDRLLTAAGIALTALLLLGGGLLGWAHSYVHGQVHDQLAAQQIFFPQRGSEALTNPAIGPYLNQYAGQQLTNGDQAKAYADHFIAVHLDEMTGGQTYAQLSAKAQADPSNSKLAGQVDTVFRGETLRGLLLNAYAFDTMGTVAMAGSIAAFGGAAALAILCGLGLMHARRAGRTPPSARQQELINA